VLVLSSNVVGVGEERLLLRNGRGADFQVFSVLMVRDALRGIKPPKAGFIVVCRRLVAGLWTRIRDGRYLSVSRVQ
jgi:hypothetical protein